MTTRRGRPKKSKIIDNLVSFDRFKNERDQSRINEILSSKDGRFMVLKFNEDDTVEIISNFAHGLKESTLLHAAYIYSLESFDMSLS
jgi:hypothetical protein